MTFYTIYTLLVLAAFGMGWWARKSKPKVPDSFVKTMHERSEFQKAALKWEREASFQRNMADGNVEVSQRLQAENSELTAALNEWKRKHDELLKWKPTRGEHGKFQRGII